MGVRAGAGSDSGDAFGGRTAGRNDGGVAFVGAVLVVLALLAGPILLVYLYPAQLERIAAGWLLVVVALIAFGFYSMSRKGRGR